MMAGLDRVRRGRGRNRGKCPSGTAVDPVDTTKGAPEEQRAEERTPALVEGILVRNRRLPCFRLRAVDLRLRRLWRGR